VVVGETVEVSMRQAHMVCLVLLESLVAAVAIRVEQPTEPQQATVAV
jgi:hypothetical protein